MIIQKDFMEQIKNNFNLNIYEVKIWTALLSRGIAAAGELSEISNVPRSRAYDVLESLERKGFIIMKVGRPIKYIAVPPEEIIKRVKQTIITDQDFHINSIDKLKDTPVFEELELLHTQGIDRVDATELSGSINGRSNVYSYIKNTIDNASKSILIVSSKEGLTRKMSFLRTNLNKAKKKGVKLQIMSGSNNIPVELREADFKKINYDGRFVIIDDSTLVFMLMKDEKGLHPSYDSAVWVKSPYFIKTVKKLLN